MHIYAETKDRLFAGIGSLTIPDNPHGSLPHLDLRLYPTESALVMIADKQGNPVPDTRFEIIPVTDQAGR